MPRDTTEQKRCVIVELPVDSDEAKLFRKHGLARFDNLPVDARLRESQLVIKLKIWSSHYEPTPQGDFYPKIAPFELRKD